MGVESSIAAATWTTRGLVGGHQVDHQHQQQLQDHLDYHHHLVAGHSSQFEAKDKVQVFLLCLAASTKEDWVLCLLHELVINNQYWYSTCAGCVDNKLPLNAKHTLFCRIIPTKCQIFAKGKQIVLEILRPVVTSVDTEWFTFSTSIGLHLSKFLSWLVIGQKFYPILTST